MRVYFFGIVLAAAVTVSGCNCGKKACTAGEVSCPCKADNACNDGLVCGNGTCSTPTLASIKVSDASARGCELVLTESGDTAVTNVGFKNGVEGQFVKQSPKVAVSFVAGGDQSISDNSVQLELAGASSGLSVSKVSCVNQAGARIAGATVQLQ